MNQDHIIYNGVPWYDQNNKPVNAKAGCLIKAAGKYYWFGEFKTDNLNCFEGFSRYASADLSTWRYEGMALPQQTNGLLGPNRIGERVKVIYNSNTQQFVMLMHTDNLTYFDPVIGVATSDTIDGEFEFHGALKLNGDPIRLWDMGTFVDRDGTAYLLTHEGNIFQLAADYLSATKVIAKEIAPGGESPAMFYQDGTYFFLFSNKTSWQRNDNYYFTASNIHGPWKYQGYFCPKGTLTYNSQCSFVFPLETNKGTVQMYMGDRWSFPRQASCATQVWLPISIKDHKMSILNYWSAWDWLKMVPVSEPKITKKQLIDSNKPGAQATLLFEGTRIILYGKAFEHGGYAQLILHNDKGKVVQKVELDFYSKTMDMGQRYVSPYLPRNRYQLDIRVMGEFSEWRDGKTSVKYGSDNSDVQITGYTVI